MTTPNTVGVEEKAIDVLLFGTDVGDLAPEIREHRNLNLVDSNPGVVVCYGGDGTLLSAELEYPGIPKVPILNSRIGHHCIRHAAGQVIAGLAEGSLAHTKYNKLKCAIHRANVPEPERIITPLNEINVHKGRINSAVRYQLWVDGDPYQDGIEILGDGFVICTPFGSSAYFSKITRGIFTKGIGIAFKATNQQINHLVIPTEGVYRVLITRGPATLAFDSSQDYVPLDAGDELVVHKHPDGAEILTIGPVRRLSEPF